MVLDEVNGFRGYLIMLSKNNVILIYIGRVLVIEIYKELHSFVLFLCVPLHLIGVIIFYLQILV